MSRTVTLKERQLTLSGPELSVGSPAPPAKLRADLFSDFSLLKLNNKPRIYSVVPSLDTPVCAVQTRRFNQEISKLNDYVFVTISCDLPTAMGRFCSNEDIDVDRFLMLSDHQYLEFGNAYGTLIPEARILCRAVFVVDAKNNLQYVEYVPEISNHPSYDQILECANTN